MWILRIVLIFPTDERRAATPDGNLIKADNLMIFI